jgi:hypothetical protein
MESFALWGLTIETKSQRCCQTQKPKSVQGVNFGIKEEWGKGEF